MSTSGTCFEGMDNIIVPRLYVPGDVEMHLYTNTGNSLSSSSVFADLTFPSGTGSGSKVLNGVWSSVDGQITYDDGSPDDVQFENTGGSTWTGGDIVGSFLHDGVYILHFKDLSAPVEMIPGAILEIDLSTFITP